VPGEYQKENLACAVAVAQELGVSEEATKKAIKDFKGLEGRLQYIKTIKGVKIYNDNNATTPEATIVGIEALVSPKLDLGEKKIVLICGGADKGLKLDNFVEVVNKYCKAVVLIPGTGTDKLISSGKVLVTSKYAKSLEDAINEAIKQSEKGDVILFSPAFASFGMFNNEYERNDLFMKIIKELK
jgi:UDP-N-acetylmuramoylalanine--D-glutamate ligase